MYNYNKATEKSIILGKRFMAYLTTSVKRKRIRYMQTVVSVHIWRYYCLFYFIKTCIIHIVKYFIFDKCFSKTLVTILIFFLSIFSIEEILKGMIKIILK